MATLYVENVPDELYEAVRDHAKKNRKSIAAEVIQALERHFPTKTELKRRKEFYKKMLEMSQREPLTPGPHPSAEEMIREDRER